MILQIVKYRYKNKINLNNLCKYKNTEFICESPAIQYNRKSISYISTGKYVKLNFTSTVFLQFYYFIYTSTISFLEIEGINIYTLEISFQKNLSNLT